MLEKFVFHEIDNIYILLDKIKKKDYSFSKQQSAANHTPLNRIREEIIDFAEKKQMEIEELKKQYPNINWTEGRLLNHASRQDMQDWIKELGLDD